MTSVMLSDVAAGGHRRWRSTSDLVNLIWIAPGFAAILVLFLLPIAAIFRDGVMDPGLTLKNYATMIGDPLYAKVFRNSLRAAALATLCCLIIGYPAAYGIFRAPPHWRKVILGAVLISLAIGTVPRTFSWLVILGDKGGINSSIAWLTGRDTPVHLLYNEFGVIIGMLHVMLPYMVLILLGSMLRVPANLVPAARTLGASQKRAFVRVFLPMTMPGILAGAMLVFVYSLGFYLVPAVLGGASQTTVVMQIENLALKSGIWGLGAALSTVVVIVSVVGAAVYVRITGLSDVAQHD